jgi:toxin CcdB
MAAYSVHANPDPRTRKDVPFLLDVQSDLLAPLSTRMVVPLYRQDVGGLKTMKRLTPVIHFQEQTLVAMVPEMAGIHLRDLGREAGNLPGIRTEILQAIDLLLTGF